MDYLNRIHNNNNQKYSQIQDAKDKEELYYACCCQTKSQPHDECSKFKFITVDDIKHKLTTENYTQYKNREIELMDQPIFNKYPEGTLNWIEGDYSQKDHLNHHILEYKVFGRVLEIQEIGHKVATMDRNERLIHVYGEDGNGKSDITNFAARYALEGRVKLHAAFHIKIEQIITQEGLKAKILDEIAKHNSLENSQSRNILKDFIDHKYLIILDKCQSFVQADRKSFSIILRELLQETKEAIFIVISDSSTDLEPLILKKYLTVNINELSCRDAYKLFMISIENNKIRDQFENQIKNEKKKDPNYEPQDHDFFTKFKRKTEIIFNSAQQVTINRSFKESLDDLCESRGYQGYSKDGSAEIMPYFNQIFKIYPLMYHRNMYVLLFLVSLSPGGLFKSDLDNLFFQSHTGLGWEQFMRFLASEDQIRNTLLNTNYDNDISINPNFLLDMEQLPGRQAQMNQMQFQLPVPQVLSKESSSVSSSVLLMIENSSQLKELLIIPQRYLKNSMKHQMAAFGLKPQETSTIYEHFLSYMIQFSRKALNMNIQRIVANYSLEELNIVVDSAFLFPTSDYKWEAKKSKRHEGCSQVCLKLIEEEDKLKEDQNQILMKLHHYEINPRGILDKDFLKTYFFGHAINQSDKKDKFPLPGEKIQQFSYQFLTLFITEEKFEAADGLLINCIEIAEYFQLPSFLAKLYLIQINLNLLKLSHKARKDEKKNEYQDNQELTDQNLLKIKRIWTNILTKNPIDEEEKKDGDNINYLLQNNQDKDSSTFHEIQFGLILSGYLKIKYDTKCYLNEQKDACLKDFDQIIRTLDEKIHLVQQKGVLTNHPQKTDLCSKVLISKIQLMQLEIMMHYLREAKGGERQEACSQMMAKYFDKVDIKFLHEKGFDRFIAIFYRLKGYQKQWVADQTINSRKMQDKCQTLHKYRQANQYLTIASKYFKEVDLKDRSDKIYQSIQYNFNKLNTVEHKGIIEKNNTILQNLICCLYSMPLIRNKKAISEIYEQDVERYLGFINKLRSLKEKERIFDEIKFLPLKQDTLEMIKLHNQCSILHISTKCYDPEFLLVENNEGVGIQKSQSELIKMLINPETNDMSHIKLAVLAFPGSYQLGMTVFTDKGVEHVISFDSIAQNQDPERALEQIDIFFWIFYEFLFDTDEPVTVTEAFHSALQSSKLKVQNFDLTMIPQLTSLVNVGKPSTLIFEKAPRLNAMNKNFEEQKHARMLPLALGKKVPHKIVGRNLEIHQVIDFILQGHSPQEKADQIMRIVGEKFIGKRSIVESAIQYLNFRETIKITSHQLEIRAPKITNMTSFKQEFHKILDNMYSSRLMINHSQENQVKIIIVYDFSDLKSEVFSSKKSSKKGIVISNELGEYFDGRCEEYRDLKIILLQSQITHDLMSQSSSRFILINSKLG